MRASIVEDDEDYVSLLKSILSQELETLHVFGAGVEFCRSSPLKSCDLVLMDWGLPDISGIDIIKWIRDVQKSDVPIMVITNKSLEADVVAAFNAGADDYMIKPIRSTELLVRAKALLRRRAVGDMSPTIDVGPYHIDFRSRLAYLSGSEIDLTEREFSIVEYLFRNIGAAVSRDSLVKFIWGRDLNSMSRTVDSHVSRIRRKLDLRRGNGIRLISIYSYGYRLEEYRVD